MISQKAPLVIGPRAKRSAGRLAPAIDQGAVRADIEAKAQGIRTNQAAFQHLLEQGLVELRAIAVEAGAVDQTGAANLDKTSAAARLHPHHDAGLFHSHRGDFPGDDLQLLALARFRDPRHHLRRRAVAMHVPPGTQVAQEALALHQRHLALRMRPQSIDDAAPAAAVPLGAIDRAPHGPHQCDEAMAGGSRVEGPGCGQADLAGLVGDGAGMLARQQAAARDGPDRTLVSSVQQRYDCVHHCESGAEDQYRCRGIEIGERALVPGIAEDRSGTGRRREISDRQHGGIDHELAADRELHGNTAGLPLHTHRFVVDDGETIAALAAPNRLGQRLLHINAEQPARREARGARRIFRNGAALLIGQAAQPIDEVIGFVREGAHIAGAHIQQVIGIAGRIGEACPESPSLLDQEDAVLVVAAPQQMQRQKRAGEAGADDADAARHGLTSRCRRGGWSPRAPAPRRNRRR